MVPETPHEVLEEPGTSLEQRQDGPEARQGFGSVEGLERFGCPEELYELQWKRSWSLELEI